MLDIHSHILPAFDDGSKSVEMTQQMLRSSKEQGVTTMMSTSHFYATKESPEQFLERRRKAIEQIQPILSDDTPQLYFGAEVLYFPGIAQSDSVRDLAIEGTKLILIEMPFVTWSSKIFRELLSLRYNTGLEIVLAHVERYRSIQSRSMFNEMFDQPFYFQCNAEAFTSFSSRRLAFHMIDEGLLHFLGTDCHNITTRPPDMKLARDAIIKKYSRSVWQDLTEEMEERFSQHIRPQR